MTLIGKLQNDNPEDDSNIHVIFSKKQQKYTYSGFPTTLTLVGPKILPFVVKVLYFQNFGRTNNCVVEVFLEWSDQPRSPSATHVSESIKLEMNNDGFV